MNTLTPYALFLHHPIELRELFHLSMYPAQKLVLEAVASKGKKPLELLLRSMYGLDDLIHQRYYYLQHYAKSSEEKILCLQYNISELADISKQQEEDPNYIDNSEEEKEYISFLFDLHMIQLGELYWSLPEKRPEAEKLWVFYQREDWTCAIVDLRPILLFRYPLFSNPSAFKPSILLSMNNKIALHTYAKALYYFTQEPTSEKAKQFLEQSLQLNSHVHSLLLQKKKLPKKPPTEFTPGEQSEALYIAHLSIETWKSIPNAINWLRATVNQKN